MKKLLLLVIAISCLALCGCGGSNDDSGNGLTPEQQEYADVVYAFADAVSHSDEKDPKNLIQVTGKTYYKSYNYKQFTDKLTDFCGKAENVEYTIPAGEIYVDTTKYQEDNVAEVSAYSNIAYTYKGNSYTIKEIHWFIVEKGKKSSAGIRAIRKYNPNDYSDEVPEFPPDLN